jgi:hypothetical protein
MPENCEYCGYPRKFFCCAAGGQVVYDERDELRLEVARLRACADAAPLADGRTCRVSMDLESGRRPCLIVTAPAHWDEAKLGHVIAGTLNLWTGTAAALAEQRAARNA